MADLDRLAATLAWLEAWLRELRLLLACGSRYVAAEMAVSGDGSSRGCVVPAPAPAPGGGYVFTEPGGGVSREAIMAIIGGPRG